MSASVQQGQSNWSWWDALIPCSSHRFVFKGTYVKTYKPFYSLLFSPFCLIINIDLVVSLLLPAHHPRCNRQAFAVGPYKWSSNSLSSLLLFYDRHSSALGPRVITACLRNSWTSQWPWKTIFTLPPFPKQCSLWPVTSPSRGLKLPGRSFPVLHSEHLRMNPAYSRADEATTTLTLWCPVILGEMDGNFQSALLPLPQPPDALGTHMLGSSSEKGSTSRELAAVAAMLCAWLKTRSY